MVICLERDADLYNMVQLMLLPLTVTLVVPEKGPLNRCACMRACVVKQSYAFSALTLLVGLQEEHLAGKNWVTTCWCGCLSGCWLFAYGPADATASQNPIISCVIKIRTGFTLWYQLTQVVLEKRPFNGCSSSCCYLPGFWWSDSWDPVQMSRGKLFHVI